VSVVAAVRLLVLLLAVGLRELVWSSTLLRVQKLMVRQAQPNSLQDLTVEYPCQAKPQLALAAAARSAVLAAQAVVRVVFVVPDELPGHSPTWQENQTEAQ